MDATAAVPMATAANLVVKWAVDLVFFGSVDLRQVLRHDYGEY